MKRHRFLGERESNTTHIRTGSSLGQNADTQKEGMEKISQGVGGTMGAQVSITVEETERNECTMGDGDVVLGAGEPSTKGKQGGQNFVSGSETNDNARRNGGGRKNAK